MYERLFTGKDKKEKAGCTKTPGSRKENVKRRKAMRELYEEKTGYVRENHRGDDKTENSEKTESAQNSSQPQTGEKGEESARTEERIRETGQVLLDSGRQKNRIHLLSVIGEIEGHENLSGSTKTTKYEHILPELAKLEDDDEVDGMLILINTVGGDVSCGLALAEMIASLSRPTVSLVIGDSHSIGVPLAVASDYSFIVPTGTMMIHPVRMTGMVIGAVQTYDYFEMIQDRILSFVAGHAQIAYDQLKRLMLNTEMLTKDLGTILVGQEAVKEGLIDQVGGIREALKKLNELIEKKKI